MMDKKDKIWINLMEKFSKSCHQKADRSFFIKSYQMPFCARCTGLFLGYIVGVFKNVFSIRLSLALIGVMALDGFLQLKKIYTSTNIRRIVTGFLCGVSIINLIKIYFIFLLNLLKRN